MPLILSVDELQPDMCLKEALISNGRVLLPGGKKLKQADISVLKRSYPGLLLRVEDPVLDDLIEFEDDSDDRMVAKSVQARIAEKMTDVSKRFTGQPSLKGVDFGAIRKSVQEIMVYLKTNPVSAAIMDRAYSSSEYLANHSGNMFYLSLLLGSAMNKYVIKERDRQSTARNLGADLLSDLSPLGLGAMFADVGMTPLAHLVDSEAQLSRADEDVLREHPQTGAAMIPESFSTVARMIIRTHHENFDGSGYPNRAPREKLHIFTRIVRIADAFDAATAQHVFKKAKSPARVLWEMWRGSHKRFYDPVLMRAFAKLVQVFPIGSRLQLSDGRYAAVVRYNRDDPYKPTILIAFDSRNRPLPKERVEGPINLADTEDLRLKSYSGEDLSYLHEDAQVSQGEAPPKVFAELFEASYP